MSGYIYFLQNPITKLPFYVGATKLPLSKRLWSHYQHLKEYEQEKRNWNKRFQYLIDLRPHKALIHLIEIVEHIEYLDEAECMYINIFKEWGFDLANQTSGGRGGDTLNYRTPRQTEQFRTRIRSKLSGVKKPEGFAEAMSKARMGANNPAAGKTKHPPVVCFNRKREAIRMFKYPYEINSFIGSKHAAGNINRMLNGKIMRHWPYNHWWEWLHDCDQQIQDIVQSHYESMSQEERDGILNVNS